MASTSHHGRSWSDLPADLLQSIATDLTGIKDYIHFRSVCSLWRSAAGSHNLPPQFPLLFLPHNPSSSLRAFFNLSTGRYTSHRFDDETPHKLVIGSSHGWVALLDDQYDVSLWNPFTGSMIRLPQIGIQSSVCKVSLTEKPTSGDCVVIAVLEESTTFAYCRLGEESWTAANTGLTSPIAAVEFRDGRFLAFDANGNGVVVGSAVMIRCPDPYGIDCLIDRMHVVKEDAGSVLMILCYHRRLDGVDDEGTRIEVLRLDDEDGGRFKWSRIRSIGKHAIFLSGNHSSIVCARDLFGCREDCIYFSALCGSSSQRHQRGVPYIDTFDMKKNSFQAIKCPWLIITDEQNATWVAPSIEYIH